MYESGPGAPPPERRGVIRFDAIGEAWSLFQAQMGAWILATFLTLIVLGVLVAPFYVFIFASAFQAGASGRESNPFAMLGVEVLMMPVIGAAATILMGGMVLMAIRQLQGEPLTGTDIFRGFSAAAPLAIAGVLMALGETIGSYLCVLPGLLMAGLWLFTYPIIVDQGLGAVEAMRLSWNTLKNDMWMALAYYFVVSLIASLGSFLCGFGMLFTYPLLPLCIAIAYRDYFPERFAGSRADA